MVKYMYKITDLTLTFFHVILEGIYLHKTEQAYFLFILFSLKPLLQQKNGNKDKCESCYFKD